VKTGPLIEIGLFFDSTKRRAASETLMFTSAGDFAIFIWMKPDDSPEATARSISWAKYAAMASMKPKSALSPFARMSATLALSVDASYGMP